MRGLEKTCWKPEQNRKSLPLRGHLGCLGRKLLAVSGQRAGGGFPPTAFEKESSGSPLNLDYSEPCT